MSLAVLLLMNGVDSETIKKLLVSKIPGYDVSFHIINTDDDLIIKAGESSVIDYSVFDVCICKKANIARKHVAIGMSAIYWESLEELSEKIDVFLQLHRHLKKYPISLKGLKLIEVLHNSQDCIVYKAIDVNGKFVAIKRFKFQSNHLSQESVRDYLNGFSLLCDIKSSGLVRLYKGGVSNNAFYMVMEYLPLGNLRRYLDSRDIVLPLKQAMAWFKGIATALNAVHQAGLIHRDLKIDNIMLREDGSLVLTDYGVSKNILLNADFLTEDEFHGSPYYVSPELIAGESCSQSSDIYSLGVIFHELLTGIRPYDGNNSHDLMLSHINEPIPSLPRHLRVFQHCLDKMMAKSSRDRFVNVSELLKSFKMACDEKVQSNVLKKTPPHFLTVS